MKSRNVYINKEAQKRANDFDKRIQEAGEKKLMDDPIYRASKEANKSPRAMFRESMTKLHQLLGNKEMTEKKLRIIRVKPQIHHIAKMCACENLMTLQTWIEQLIKKEIGENKWDGNKLRQL